MAGQVKPTSEVSELKREYHRLSKILHPDKTIAFQHLRLDAEEAIKKAPAFRREPLQRCYPLLAD